MENIDNPIAEFRSSIYQDGFGFDVTVYQKDTDIFYVNSAGLLNDSYNSFEAFLDDLIIRNPLWFTYYLVRVDIKYEQMVKTKLKDSINKVFRCLDHSVFCTEQNWVIGNEPLGDFMEKTLQETVVNHHRLDFLTNK